MTRRRTYETTCGGRAGRFTVVAVVIALVSGCISPPTASDPDAGKAGHRALGGRVAPDSTAVPAPPAGYALTWSDDFNAAAGTGLDAGTWQYDVAPGSTFGTGEIDIATDSTRNVFHDGSGSVVLRAEHSGSDPESGWTSARVETRTTPVDPPSGGIVQVQASIQQPNLTTANGAGYWPAFWMLGSTIRSGTPWPTGGEVDILEGVNARDSAFGTMHCGVEQGGPCNEPAGIGSDELRCGGCGAGYHTYAVQIDRSVSPEQIRWYLDGVNYFTASASQMDADTWANAVHHPFFIIFDLAIGGGFPAALGGGPNAATASGGQMKIGYVAVFTKRPPG